MLVYDDNKGRWADYTVTPTDNKFNGYVEDNQGRLFQFSKPAEKYIPVYKTPKYYTTVDIWVDKSKRKPSIYKRPFPLCTRDEYKHQFTNVVRKTVEETHDVYYNAKRDKFIDKVSTETWFNDSYIY